MDCSPPGSSVHGIFQARILEWVAISSPGDLPNPGIKPKSLTLQADSLPSEPSEKLWLFTVWAVREALYAILHPKVSLIHFLLLLHITTPANALNYLCLDLPASDHLQPQIYLDHNLLKKYLPSTTEMILLKSKCDFTNIWLKFISLFKGVIFKCNFNSSTFFIYKTFHRILNLLNRKEERGNKVPSSPHLPHSHTHIPSFPK